MLTARILKCPLVALSGHPTTFDECQLLGAKRTSRGHWAMSANDAKGTFDHTRLLSLVVTHEKGRRDTQIAAALEGGDRITNGRIEVCFHFQFKGF